MENLTPTQENTALPAGTPAPSFFERFNRSRIATIAIFAIVAVAFFFMNHWTPIWTFDDVRYSFLHSEDPLSQEKISSLADLCVSFKEHYMELNGRLSDGLFTKIFLIGDKWIFDILNTLAFCGVIALLAKICFTETRVRKIPNAFWLGIFALTWWTLPAFGTLLWVAGSANYLWSMLFFALFFIEYECAAREKFSPARLALAFVVAFIAGWMNEAFPIPFFVGAFFYAVFFKKIPSKQNLILLAGLALGFAIIVVSPGQLGRASGLLDISKLLKQATATLTSPLSSPWLLAIFVLIVILFFRAKKSGAHRSHEWQENALPIFCAIGGFVAITMISGEICETHCMGLQYWGAWFFAIIAFLRILLANKNAEKIFKIVGSALAICVVPAFIFSAYQLIEIKKEIDELFATARTTTSGFVPQKQPFYTRASETSCPWLAPLGGCDSYKLRRITGVDREVFLVEESVFDFLANDENFKNFGAFKSFHTPTMNYTIVKISPEEKALDFTKWNLGIRFFTEKFSFFEKLKHRALVAVGADKKYTTAPISEFFVFEKNGKNFVILASPKIRASLPNVVISVIR